MRYPSEALFSLVAAIFSNPNRFDLLSNTLDQLLQRGIRIDDRNDSYVNVTIEDDLLIVSDFTGNNDTSLIIYNREKRPFIIYNDNDKLLYKDELETGIAMIRENSVLVVTSTKVIFFEDGNCNEYERDRIPDHLERLIDEEYIFDQEVMYTYWIDTTSSRTVSTIKRIAIEAGLEDEYKQNMKNLKK